MGSQNLSLLTDSGPKLLIGRLHQPAYAGHAGQGACNRLYCLYFNIPIDPSPGGV